MSEPSNKLPKQITKGKEESKERKKETSEVKRKSQTTRGINETTRKVSSQSTTKLELQAASVPASQQPSRKAKSLTKPQKSFLRSMCHTDFVARNTYGPAPPPPQQFQPPKDPYYQVKNVIGTKCIKEYIPFDFDEFVFIVESVKYVKRVDDDDFHLKNERERMLLIPFHRLKVSMSLEFMVFVLVYYLHSYCNLNTLYNTMNLDVFTDLKTAIDKRRFASTIVRGCVDTLMEPLYDSLVNSRGLIDITRRIPLSSGRPEIMNYIIPELKNSYFIVDGVNMDISKQKDDDNHVIKEFYNPKSKWSGKKYLIFQDIFGFCAYMTNTAPAAVHDASLYKEDFNSNLIPDGTYCIGDGGFRGMKRCITPYPRKCKDTLFENTFITEGDKLCYYTGWLTIPDSTPIKVTIQCLCGYYGVMEIKDNVWTFDGSCKGTGQQINITGNTTPLTKMNEDVIKSLYSVFEFEFKCAANVCVDVANQEQCDKYQLDNVHVDGVLMNMNGRFQFVGEMDGQYNNQIINGLNASKDSIKLYNACLSSIRINVENFFGRRNVLFKICSETYHLSMNMFDNICKITCALTNVHIQFHGLRAYPFYLFSPNITKELRCQVTALKKIPLPKKAIEILEKYCGRNDITTVGCVNKTTGNRGRVFSNTTLTIPNNTFIPILNNDNDETLHVDAAEAKRIKAADADTLMNELQQTINIQDSSLLFSCINDNAIEEQTTSIIPQQMSNQEIQNTSVINDTTVFNNDNNMNEYSNTAQPEFANDCFSNDDDLNEICRSDFYKNIGRDDVIKLNTLKESSYVKADSNYIDSFIDQFSKNMASCCCFICKTEAYQVLYHTNVNTLDSQQILEENYRLFGRGSPQTLLNTDYYVFIPCNFKEHWMLVMWDMKTNIFYAFNSFHAYYTEQTVTVITDYVTRAVTSNKLVIADYNVLQQKDRWSCGYRMLHFLYLLTEKKLYLEPKKLMDIKEEEFVRFSDEVLKYNVKNTTKMDTD